MPAGTVRLIMADTALAPDDGGTVREPLDPVNRPGDPEKLRRGPDLLARTAARHWGVDLKTVEVRDGKAVERLGSRALLRRSRGRRHRLRGVRGRRPLPRSS